MKKSSLENGFKRPLVVLVFSALLAALSIVLGKYLAFNLGEFLRFSLENLPIILAAVTLGPVIAAAVGAVADVIGCFLVGYTINPLITVGGATVGLVSGLVYKVLGKTKLSTEVKLAISVISGHIVGSVIVKSFGLMLMYSTPLTVLIPWRTLNYVIIGCLEVIVLSILLRNKAIVKMFNTAKEKQADGFKSFANSFQAVTVPGLERIRELCKLLGNPQKKLKFIHVAGTNGKGSTCANLSCILEDAGFKVGKFISPNLIKVNERISVNGQNISDKELDDILSEIEPLSKKVEEKLGLAPTQFEIWTAAAFLYFERMECDYVVLEVGLGGELDATNVIDSCVISIITRLGLDHTQYLGETISEIAAAKAGIIKKEQLIPLVITVNQDPCALSVLKSKTDDCCYELITVTPEHRYTDGACEVFSIAGIEDIKCGICGYHQIENAALAVTAAKKLGIDEKSIKSGVLRARNPARFEIISKNPTVIYDGGHNENGIEALINSLNKYYPNTAKTVVFACMKDKEIKKSLQMLGCGDTKFLFTTVKDNPRADTAAGILERAEKYGFSGEAFDEIGAAYEKAISYGRLTVICGSLYLYADLMEYLNSKT